MKRKCFTGTVGDFPGRRIQPGIKLLLLVFLFFGEVNSWGQITKQYADTETHNSHVLNPGNAVDDTDLTDFATLESYGGLLLGGGKYTGQLELQFSSPLPAGTTSYVKIDFDDDVLNALLGGNLGGALADLLGTVVLGNHYFNVEARLGTTTVLTGSGQDEFDSEALRLIIGANGDFFLAITPDTSYDRIFIEDETSAVLLGTTNSMQVYSAFYVTGQDICEPAFATSFDGSGGTVDLVGLGQAGVTNPEFAIDGDETTSSELSPGVVTLAGSLSQTIYFSSLSAPTDEYRLRLFVDSPALLNLSLLDGITIEALNGETVVSTTTLGALLDLDLLGLLNTDEIITVSFVPGNSFDRIRVTINAVLDVNLSKTLKIYEAYRFPSTPQNPWNTTTEGPTICYNETAQLTAISANTNELRWYLVENGGMPVATTSYDETFTTPTLTEDKTYYVSARSIGCTKESERILVKVTVLPDIDNPDLTIDDVED